MSKLREYEVTVGTHGFFGTRTAGKFYIMAKSKTEAQDNFYKSADKEGLTGEVIVMNIEEVV